MTRPVQLDVAFEEEDWLRWGTYRADGVLSGYVTLHLNGLKVLDYDVVGLNNSVISLLRSVVKDHKAATSDTEDSAEWPLFFCPSHLRNRCGVIIDFNVVHKKDAVVFSAFLRCQVPRRTRVVVPWRAWALQVERVATATLRRLPPVKVGVKIRHLSTYARFRFLLKKELHHVRVLLDERGGAAKLTPN